MISGSHAHLIKAAYFLTGALALLIVAVTLRLSSAKPPRADEEREHEKMRVMKDADEQGKKRGS